MASEATRGAYFLIFNGSKGKLLLGTPFRLRWAAVAVALFMIISILRPLVDDDKKLMP
jgi:hypothetical protein